MCLRLHIWFDAGGTSGWHKGTVRSVGDCLLETKPTVVIVPLILARSFLVLLVFAGLSLAHAQPRQLDWRTFVVPDFGTSIVYPAEIFTPAGEAEKGAGQRFERADGRAVLSIYARQNEGGETPTTYLKHNLRMDRSALDYVRVARSFFAISSERDGVILYSRCNFSTSTGRAIHCFDLKYPQQEKRSWDAIVTRISLSLRPLES
jgi:hypothetical protein